jgi:aldose 1-epimerase
MTLTFQPFGSLADGRTATLYQLTHPDGFALHVTDYGATMVGLFVPDTLGVPTNVILGYDSLEKYQRQTYFVGGIAGRFANRIRNGRFLLNGETVQLTVNTPPHHLHGGQIGFDRRLWQATTLSDDSVTLEYVSENGEEGYPGRLRVRVTYTLVIPRTLRLDIVATSDAATIANITAHPYFNLAGQENILGHELMIPATHFTPVDETMIPTGDLHSVADTPLDFRTPTAIGARIHTDHPQLTYGNGYDHNFVLKSARSADLVLAAHLRDPASGHGMEIHSTHPGLQFYSGNFLADEPLGRDGVAYGPYSGVALEPQNFPDAPNHPHFPSALVMPEQPYRERIEYRFYGSEK